MNSSIKTTPPPSTDGKLEFSVFVNSAERCSNLKYSNRYEPLISLGSEKIYLMLLIECENSLVCPKNPPPNGPLSTSDDMKYAEK
jgi:hypothetical protein